MKKVFVLLLALFALNLGMIAYAEEAEISEASAQSELPEGVAPLPEFVTAE
jgi:hypothetical protein